MTDKELRKEIKEILDMVACFGDQDRKPDEVWMAPPDALENILDLISKDRAYLTGKKLALEDKVEQLTQALHMTKKEKGGGADNPFHAICEKQAEEIKELQAEVKRLKEEVTQSHYDTADWIRKYDELQAKLKLKEAECQEIIHRCQDAEAKLDVAREVLKEIKPVLDKHWFSTEDVGDGYVEDFNNDDVIEASEQVKQALEKIG